MPLVADMMMLQCNAGNSCLGFGNSTPAYMTAVQPGSLIPFITSEYLKEPNQLQNMISGNLQFHLELASTVKRAKFDS